MISKISKGSRMDQIYIPKSRIPGYEIGKTVLIKPIEETKPIKPFYYNTQKIEPIKTIIIEKITNYLHYTENLIITGSFLDKGFNFNDIDLIILDEKQLNLDKIRKELENNIGIEFHIIQVDNKTLLQGLNTDPLFQAMLSRFVSKKRLVYRIKKQINYKLLDLHLLKSKALIDGFDYLKGHEKYNLIRNIITIELFIKNKKITTENINKEIRKYFKVEVRDIKENIIDKNILHKYKRKHKKIFNIIMKGIKDE